MLGHVLAVPNYGAGDILEIGGEGRETRLIPFTRAAVPEVRVAAGYVVVDPPVEVEGEPPHDDEAGDTGAPEGQPAGGDGA